MESNRKEKSSINSRCFSFLEIFHPWRLDEVMFVSLAEAFIGEMRALDRFAKEKKVVGRERQEPIRNPTAQGKNSSKNTCTLIWSGF